MVYCVGLQQQNTGKRWPFSGDAISLLHSSDHSLRVAGAIQGAEGCHGDHHGALPGAAGTTGHVKPSPGTNVAVMPMACHWRLALCTYWPGQRLHHPSVRSSGGCTGVRGLRVWVRIAGVAPARKLGLVVCRLRLWI
jgi:hypothetical protein